MGVSLRLSPVGVPSRRASASTSFDGRPPSAELVYRCPELSLPRRHFEGVS